MKEIMIVTFPESVIIYLGFHCALSPVYFCTMMRSTLTNEYRIVFKPLVCRKDYIIEKRKKNMLNRIKDMKVEKKLKTCFSTAILLASLSGFIGLLILIYCNFRYNDALINYGFSQGEIGIFSTYLSKEPTIIRELILLDDEDSMQESYAELQSIQTITDESYETMKLHCQTKQKLVYIDQIELLLPEYRALFDQVRDLAMQNKNDEAFVLLIDEAKPKFEELTDAVESLIDLEVTSGNKLADSLTIQSYAMMALMLVIIIAAFIVAMRISKMVARIIAEPTIQIQEATKELTEGRLDIQVEKLYSDEIGEMTDSFNLAIRILKQYVQELTRVLTRLSEGDFTVTAEVQFKGDFSELNGAIDTITSSLNTALTNIHESSNQVSMGAGQMAESAQALAEGATDQAASVQQLTATIQNITETVIHSSEKANESYQNAKEFKHKAEESNEDILLLNEAMERINNTSNEIATIIATIEDIASQTNLLSLNASIEAARAGEAGKGFAVVADQIGKLASDSATAAIDTKKLIEHSLEEIDHGNAIVEKATTAIDSVIKGINSLADSTNEISEMSDSQADAMKQLESGIEQISEVIQNNSAAAEETSATSEELSAQSEALEQLVGQFTLK